MRIAKHANGYYYAHYFAGKELGNVEISLKTKDRTAANTVAQEANLKQIELLARAGSVTQDAVNKITRKGQSQELEKMAEQWRSWMVGVNMSRFVCKNKYDAVMGCLRFIKAEKANADTVTDAHISSYINRPGPAKASTRKVALSAIRSFFHWMRDNNYCAKNPAGIVRVQYQKLSHDQKEKVERVPITDDEVAKIVAHCEKKGDIFWKLATLMGRRTALRIGDIATLEWATFGAGTMSVWTDKRDKRVDLEMDETLLLTVLSIPQDHQTYCFPNERHTYIDENTRAQLSVQFKRLLERCGIKGKSFHCLRHARATEINNESGIEEAAKQLGHSSTKTTEGYVHK